MTGLWDVPWRVHAAVAHRRTGRREEAAQLIAEQLRLVQAFGVRRHVADALTNQQITENLFVTEKTVETHPGRARREPGVRSRAQLAVRMCAR